MGTARAHCQRQRQCCEAAENPCFPYHLYLGTRKFNLGTGPGMPWFGYATERVRERSRGRVRERERVRERRRERERVRERSREREK